MKVNRSNNLLPVLIIPAFIHAPLALASPVRRRQELASILHDIGLDGIVIRSTSAPNCLKSADDPCSSAGQDVSVAELIVGFVGQLTRHFDTRTTEEYPYLLPTGSLITTQPPVASVSSSSVVQSWPAALEQSPTALIAGIQANSDSPERTTFYATFNEDDLRMGTSQSFTTTHKAIESTMASQNSVVNFHPIATDHEQLVWLVFLLIPAGLAVALWLFYRHRCESSDDEPNDYTMARSDSSHTLSSSNSLGIIDTDHKEMNLAENAYSGMFLDPLPELQAEDFGFPTLDRDTREVEVDRFAHLQTAPFPSKQDLCSFVFPATSVAVEREIMVHTSHKEPLVTPSTTTIGRVLTANRFVYPSNRTLVPPAFGTRSLGPSKKRFSPLGEVLYSTGGKERLETVEEEASETCDVDTPKPTFKVDVAGALPDSNSESVIFASSHSYIAEPHTRLRERRKSSPIMPSPSLKGESEDLFAESQLLAPPLNRFKRSNKHRRSVNTVNLESLLTSNGGTSPVEADEEQKFTQFVKDLVKRADELRMERERSTQRETRYRHVQIMIPNAPQEQVKVPFTDEYEGLRGDFLAPPSSTSAHLSDFSSSSSISSDMAPSVSDNSMVGLAL